MAGLFLSSLTDLGDNTNTRVADSESVRPEDFCPALEILWNRPGCRYVNGNQTVFFDRVNGFSLYMQSSPRRFQLRERTSKSHARVDSLVGSLGSLADYRRYLDGMQAFRLPLEAMLLSAPLPALLSPWCPKSIGAELLTDLADLHVPVRRHAAAGAERDISRLCGIGYVVEGSALGAKVLYRRAQALGFDSRFGARHLARQSEDVGSWSVFLAVLEDLDEFDIDTAASAANATFAAAEHAFAGLQIDAA